MPSPTAGAEDACAKDCCCGDLVVGEEGPAGEGGSANIMSLRKRAKEGLWATTGADGHSMWPSRMVPATSVVPENGIEKARICLSVGATRGAAAGVRARAEASIMMYESSVCDVRSCSRSQVIDSKEGRNAGFELALYPECQPHVIDCRSGTDRHPSQNRQ